jgi:oleate hydratase
MRAFVIGGGIAGLAACTYLISDGHLRGADIQLFEAGDRLGGALDARGDDSRGYSMRGGRMFEEKESSIHHLFSLVPSLRGTAQSLESDIRDFHANTGWHNHARLIGEAGARINSAQFGLSARNMIDLVEVMLTPEARLAGKTIADCLDLSILDTNFWFMFGSIFAFLPWHGAAEFRRYLIRFLHLLPDMSEMKEIQRTPLNQYEAAVVPLRSWLTEQGVEFHLGAEVTNIAFSEESGALTPSGIGMADARGTRNFDIGPDDTLFVTLGSHVSCSTAGTMTAPPPPPPAEDPSWRLWKHLSRGRQQFGNPDAFRHPLARTGWITFTVTTRTQQFSRLMESLTGSKPGRGGLITLTDSNWLLTIAGFHNPHFRSQSKGTGIWWGYGLYLDRPGNYVSKPMPACSGEEIMREVLHHLGLAGHGSDILQSSTVIPVLLPHAGSVLLPRQPGDRPDIVPKHTKNLALLGQFVEMPGEVAFTTEYAVRSARIAVASLLGTGGQPPPPYSGLRDPHAMLAAARALLR